LQLADLWHVKSQNSNSNNNNYNNNTEENEITRARKYLQNVNFRY